MSSDPGRWSAALDAAAGGLFYGLYNLALLYPGRCVTAAPLPVRLATILAGAVFGGAAINAVVVLGGPGRRAGSRTGAVMRSGDALQSKPSSWP